MRRGEEAARCVCARVCVHLSGSLLWSAASVAADADPDSGSWLLSELWLQPRSHDRVASFSVAAAASEQVASMLS